MKPEQTPVRMIFADNTVGIMWFVTKDGFDLDREATKENIQMEINKASISFDAEKVPVKSWKVIAEGDIPKDRDFRNAWVVKEDAIGHDIECAKKIHLERLRYERALLFTQKDGEWMRAVGQGKKQEADAIEKERQALRDLPVLDDIKTVGELKNVKLGVKK